MNYLIIGGAGFIGSNFAQQLLSRGEQVTILDNLSRPGSAVNLAWLQKNYPAIKFIAGDVRHNRALLDAAVGAADIVFHLAGQVAVTTSILEPYDDFVTNALGTLHILEAIRKSGGQQILIYASTNKVYGGMNDLEIVEEAKKYAYRDLPNGISEKYQLDFHSPYGCSKGSADQYIRDYARIYNLKSVVMRQSCIYGTRQFGVEDQGWVAWFTIASALNKDITIYGDGKQVRDVLFVDDLFAAWDAATKNIEIARGQIYNVGGGKNMAMSLLELIAYLEQFLGKTIKLDYADWRSGDQKVYISDISKIKKELGWEPKTTPINGVKLLHDWVTSNLHLFKE
jgi:CDP-paratose 2-epimerase